MRTKLFDNSSISNSKYLHSTELYYFRHVANERYFYMWLYFKTVKLFKLLPFTSVLMAND